MRGGVGATDKGSEEALTVVAAVQGQERDAGKIR